MQINRKILWLMELPTLILLCLYASCAPVEAYGKLDYFVTNKQYKKVTQV